MSANRSERLTLFRDGAAVELPAFMVAGRVDAARDGLPSVYLTVPRDAWPERLEPVTAVAGSDAILTSPICDGTVDGAVRDVDSSAVSVEFRLVETAAGR